MLYEKCVKVQDGQVIPQNKLSEFMSKFNTYMPSASYINNCKKLFNIVDFQQDAIFAVCFKIMTFLRKSLLKTKSESLPVDTNQEVQSRTSFQQLTSTARGKIRYVAGYAVASLRTKYNCLMRASLYKTSKSGISTYLSSKTSLEILDNLQINEMTLTETTSDPESLCETSRKQNMTRGLTNVTDATYQ